MIWRQEGGGETVGCVNRVLGGEGVARGGGPDLRETALVVPCWCRPKDLEAEMGGGATRGHAHMGQRRGSGKLQGFFVG